MSDAACQNIGKAKLPDRRPIQALPVPYRLNINQFDTAFDLGYSDFL